MSYIPEKMKNKEPYIPVGGDFDVRLDANESPFDISLEVKKEFAEEMLVKALDIRIPQLRNLEKHFLNASVLCPKMS